MRLHSAEQRGQLLPLLAGSAEFGALQDMVGSFGCQGTLLSHVLLPDSQYTQIPLCRAALQLPVLSVCIATVLPSQVQYPALALVKIHVVDNCPAHHFVRFSPQGLSIFKGTFFSGPLSPVSCCQRLPGTEQGSGAVG